MRKARTRSTDRSPNRQQRKLRQIRLEVAAEAAKIIATEGQSNFHLAKRKAAERIGVSERVALPSNLEVQEALQSYQLLYGGTAHGENLRQLRTVAERVMLSLQDFSPRLVGPVLEGTAGPHSRVSLQVFTDTTETLLLHLLERSIPFAEEQRRIRWSDGGYRSVPVVVVECQGCAVELLLLPELCLRQAPPSPIDGRPQRRASLADLQSLLSAQPEPGHWAMAVGPAG